jgi:subtilisin family serine protease
MGGRIWCGAIAVLLAAGLAAAEPRLKLSAADAKLETHLRPRATTPSTTLIPLGPRGSKARVFVTVTSTDATDLKTLRRAGLRIDRVLTKHNLVRGRIRKKDLGRLAALDLVRSVAPVRRGHLRVGSVTTEGDAFSRAPQARATGFDGTGVTVGVISDGIDSVALSIISGDLPVGTGLPVPPSSTCAAGEGDEGTAKLEIVHDIAPGATLRFSEGISDKLAFVDAIDCLRDAGAKVIVDDIGFLDEPFFEDGVVAEAVREAVEAGVSFHSAAGNAGNIHYSAPFAATITEDGTYHAFGAGPDLFNRMEIPAGGNLSCVLQWNDRFGSSANDYDLELWSLDGTPVLIDFSSNVQNGTQDPFEGVGIHNAGPLAHVGVRVRREAGADRLLKLVCLGALNLQRQTPEGSIFGHPSVPGAVAVGAIDVADFGLNEVELFSSQGPVEIFFPTAEEREKPDLVAFDGVTTSVCPDENTTCFDPFFGTSAAAPHAAGVAALLLSKNGCLSPAEVQARLMSAADDILALGFDDVSGAGRLDAFDTLTAPDACDDGNPCTRDTCSPGTGCQNTNLTDGAACPDGNLCNGNETCQGGTCTAGAPLVCNDASLCTTDSCDVALGCVFQNTCADGNPCSTDICNPATGCSHANAPDGTTCPDDDACNGTETCQAGACTPSTTLTCDDGPACTTSACDAASGCQYTPLAGRAGVTCLCAQGLGFPGCTPPAVASARFARACEIIASSSGARSRRARQLLSSAVQKLNRGRQKTRRAGNREKLTPDCAHDLEAAFDDLIARTLLLSGSL